MRVNLDRYEYYIDASFHEFEFESHGPKGRIRKIASFEALEADLYNFGFGDLDKNTGEIDDPVVSNNGDTNKILATVASIIVDFTLKFQDKGIFIKGSTDSRTRLYQIGISKNLNEMEKVFEVLGHFQEQWEPFRKGKNYDAFFVRRKN